MLPLPGGLGIGRGVSCFPTTTPTLPRSAVGAAFITPAWAAFITPARPNPPPSHRGIYRPGHHGIWGWLGNTSRLGPADVINPAPTPFLLSSQRQGATHRSDSQG